MKNKIKDNHLGSFLDFFKRSTKYDVRSTMYEVRHTTHGFTMIEIMLVVIIIGILAAMVVPNLAGRGEQARKSTARVDIETNIASAIDMYEVDNGRFPTTEQGLEALISKPSSSPEPKNWSGPYLKKKKMPTDPWGHAYVYTAPGVHNSEGYDLSSYGHDGIESADDIANWEKSDSSKE